MIRINHHRLFTLIRRAEAALIALNLLLLLVITRVPFPTAILAALWYALRSSCLANAPSARVHVPASMRWVHLYYTIMLLAGMIGSHACVVVTSLARCRAL